MLQCRISTSTDAARNNNNNMTVTSDRHRMNVNDLHKFEKNITGWFQQWDRQRNLTTSSFARNNRLQSNGSPHKTNGNNTEMHTRALLDCKTTVTPCKQAARKSQEATTAKSKGASAFAAKLRNLRCQSLSLKTRKNDPVLVDAGSKVWTISKKPSFARLTPVKEADVSRQSAPKDAPSQHGPGLERRCSSHSNMYSLLLSLKEDVTPNRQRRFPRTNSLRRFVTLREHRKKCEMGLIKVGASNS